MVETDEIDEAIIRVLQIDGRASNREVARQLELSEGTVRQRLKRLQEAGALRLGAVVDPARLGLSSGAYVLLQIAPADLRATASRIASLEQASFVAILLGDFNLMAVFQAKSREDLAALIDRELLRNPNVLHVEVDEFVSVYKYRYDVVRIKQV